MGEGGIPSTGLWGRLGTGHATLDRWDGPQVVSHIYAQVGEEEADTTRSHRGCAREQSERAGAAGGRLCGAGRAGCPLVPMRGCDWVVRIIPQAGRELRPATQREAGVALGLFGEECGLACRSRGVGSLRVRPSLFSPDVKPHMTLDLNFRPVSHR